ncbi:PE-PGRS family protein [Spirosoma endbachense]|uniref:PE-PGRS family protein n=1 Tax=Spirosoma endbachense TaxID=2666025 RepID=A0A6P1VXN2_9BACT|nr:PE-PGRS family protein [Spirosoma endbachense]QHV97404.1 PE-PGRS family protein [Spirosoma endbachense]
MRIVLLVLGTLTVVSCTIGVTPDAGNFSSNPTSTPVTPGQINEASGLADSRTQPGNLWIEQDSGSPAELALLGYDGKLKGKMSIPNTTNIDWEDMTIGPGPQDGKNYIYIADIGDNNAQRPTSVLYRFIEPANLQETIGQVERINYKYPDGPRDAEAFIVDPQTRDTWIISKREEKVHLYRLPYPQDINQVTTLQTYGELPSFGDGLAGYVTSAAISPDGGEILVRTYTGIFYWKRTSGQTVADALQKGTRSLLTSRMEPQGEAICFDKDGKGFFTISELASASSVNLYYYARQ